MADETGRRIIVNNEGRRVKAATSPLKNTPFSVKIGRIFWVHFTSKLFQIVFFNKRENSI